MAKDQQLIFDGVSQVLANRWNLEPIKGLTREELLQMLAEHLGKMIKEDFAGLVNLMYRLDVPEQKFHEALNLTEGTNPENKLAEIVLDREIERMNWRIKYSGK